MSTEMTISIHNHTSRKSLAAAVEERAKDLLAQHHNHQELWETMITILAEDLGHIEGRSGEHLEVIKRYNTRLELVWGGERGSNTQGMRLTNIVGERPWVYMDMFFIADRSHLKNMKFYIDNSSDVERLMGEVCERVAKAKAEADWWNSK